MYILMKDGKYFTGIIIPSAMQAESESPNDYLEFIAWSHHPSTAKVWEKHRSWADRAAMKWGGTVIEVQNHGC